MIFIYDVVANFNDDLIDFYDWLLVLEEVPEGYQLIINDKRIDIPATT